MIDPNPCKGCTERYPACHDHCEKRAKWLEQHLGQKKHLQDNKNRWSVPMTAAREKAYEHYYHKSSKGGSYEK